MDIRDVYRYSIYLPEDTAILLKPPQPPSPYTRLPFPYTHPNECKDLIKLTKRV